MSLGRYERLVDRLILLDHGVDRELTRDRIAAVGSGRQRRTDTGGQIFEAGANPPVHAVLHDFLDRAAGKREHRSAAGHRFDHDESERLLPLNREQERSSPGEQRVFLCRIDLANVFDLTAVDVRGNLLLPVLPEDRLDLSSELQPDTRTARRANGEVRRLARMDATEKGDVIVFRR